MTWLVWRSLHKLLLIYDLTLCLRGLFLQSRLFYLPLKVYELFLKTWVRKNNVSFLSSMGKGIE
jgi:hypothetical protein